MTNYPIPELRKWMIEAVSDILQLNGQGNILK